MVKHSNHKYYGSTVVGEKGQIVIPAEARKEFQLDAGDKVMVFGHHGAMLIIGGDVVADYVSRGLARFGELARVLSEETFAEGGDPSSPPSAVADAAE